MRGKNQATFKGARLDRAVCMTHWLTMFPEATVKHLPMTKSDHAPILISTENKNANKTGGFKFQAAWLTHHDFSRLIKDNCNDGESAFKNGQIITLVLQAWNRDVFENIHKWKKKLTAHIEGIQKALARKHHNGLIKLDRKLN